MRKYTHLKLVNVNGVWMWAHRYQGNWYVAGELGRIKEAFSRH